MPDWQENLLPGNRAGNQAIKLIVGPALAKEGAREYSLLRELQDSVTESEPEETARGRLRYPARYPRPEMDLI